MSMRNSEIVPNPSLKDMHTCPNYGNDDRKLYK
jgi:hypothetical protein